MTGDQADDVDVEALRSDLDHIKEAMGIREQYAGATSVWLLFGILVPVAAGLSQFVHLREMPAVLHTVIWAVVLGGGYAAWLVFAHDGDEFSLRAGPGKPNLLVQFVLVYLAAVPLQVIVFAYVDGLGYHAESALVLAMILVLLGVAYGVFGSSLAAYRVRWRDRAVFFVGTAWMIALGVAIPLVEPLELWCYAVFGVTYLVYALGAYGYLVRSPPVADDATGAGGERT